MAENKSNEYTKKTITTKTPSKQYDLNIVKDSKESQKKQKQLDSCKIENKKIGIVTAPLLNVRKGPGFKYCNILRCPTLKADAEVEIQKEIKSEEDSSSWYEIKFMNLNKEYKGFVNKEFILLKK